MQDPKLLRRLLRAKDRMDAASHEDWPVRRLAEVSGVSEAHFARSFKLAFGLPPHRYLLTRRIERATTLLRDTELSVTEIAFHTGWGSLGTFGRTFRDIQDLKRLLAGDERTIARNLAKQLVVYATGAPVRFGDRPEIERILDRARPEGYGVRTLIREIVQSDLFLNK